MSYFFKKVFCFTLFFMGLSIVCFGQNDTLFVDSFKKLPNDLDARVNHPVKDQNGEKCALIKVVTDKKGFSWDAGVLGITKVENKTGEYWVYIPRGSKKLTIKHDKFGVLRNYVFPVSIDKATVYQMNLITKTDGLLKAKAPQASIFIDNEKVGENSIERRLKKGEYTVVAKRDKFYNQRKKVKIEPGSMKSISFNLTPKMGNLIIKTNLENGEAKIYINNRLNKNKTPANIPLKVGRYQIRLEKDGYLPVKNQVKIKENQKTEIEAEFEKDPKFIAQKHKKGKYIWSGATLAAAGFGTYSLTRANTLYEKYKDAGENASKIRSKVETWDIITPVSYGVAGLFAIPTVIQFVKHNKAKQRIQAYSIPSNEGIIVGLSFKF